MTSSSRDKAVKGLNWKFTCPIAKSMYVIYVCFLALRPKSTAMVIAGRSVHLTTLFPGQA